MAPRKAVKAKRKPRKQQYQIVDITDLRIDGIRIPPGDFVPIWVDAEPFTFTGTGTFDIESLALLFDVPVWMICGPVNPITRSAYELKRAAGAGPYHCKHCGATYKFFHPTCRAEQFGVTVQGGVKYVFSFENRICDEELESITRSLRVLGVPGIVVDQPCHIYKLDR